VKIVEKKAQEELAKKQAWKDAQDTRANPDDDKPAA
jgi:hypothetical protein